METNNDIYNGEARATVVTLKFFSRAQVTYGLPKSTRSESRCMFDRHDGNE